MIQQISVGIGNLDYARSATAKAIALAKELRESRLDDVHPVIDVPEVRFAAECEQAGVEYHLQRETGEALPAEAASYCRVDGYQPKAGCAPKPPLFSLLPYTSEWGAVRNCRFFLAQ
ncbi:MAG: hypothetical protein MK171_04340 [Pirellulales bacterium]|nr:hypothetical protein [Pirellulales bacterium]